MLLACLLTVLLATTPGAPDAADRSWEARLQDHLRHQYATSQPPPATNVTEVKIELILKNFFFDMREERFNAIWRLLRDWVDVRLAWDPAAFGDIKETQILARDLLWVPRIKLRNSFTRFPDSRHAECVVWSLGAVQCHSDVIYNVECSPIRLGAWPYDTRTCRFEFDDSGRENVVFTFGGKRGVSMLGAEYGPVWTITDYAQRDRGAKSERLQFSLTLEREGAALAALTVWPALALSALSLLAVALPALTHARAPLAAFSLAAHFVLLQMINRTVPQSGPDPPTILLYVRGSIIVTTASFIVACGLRRLAKAGQAPQWVAQVTARVAQTPARLLLPSQRSPHSLADAVARRHEAELLDFVTLCGVLDFILEVVIYLSLYLVFVPRPPPFT